MNLWQSITRILLLAGCAMLVSCFECREEFWLEADGSGRAEMDCSLPASAALMQGGEQGIRKTIDDFLKETPEIQSSSHEVCTQGDRTRVKIHVAFASALDLLNLTAGPAMKHLPSAVTHLAGQIQSKVRGRTLELTRTISPGKALPGSVLLPASQWDGYEMVTIMHLPVAATESNASRVENGGRTLIWETPLAKAVRSPISHHFKMDIPIPWRLITTYGLPISLICAFLLLRLRKSRKR